MQPLIKILLSGSLWSQRAGQAVFDDRRSDGFAATHLDGGSRVNPKATGNGKLPAPKAAAEAIV